MRWMTMNTGASHCGSIPTLSTSLIPTISMVRKWSMKRISTYTWRCSRPASWRPEWDVQPGRSRRSAGTGNSSSGLRRKFSVRYSRNRKSRTHPGMIWAWSEIERSLVASNWTGKVVSKFNRFHASFIQNPPYIPTSTQSQKTFYSFDII